MATKICCNNADSKDRKLQCVFTAVIKRAYTNKNMQRLLQKPFVRYVIVGVGSFVIDYLILVSLYHGVHTPLVVASTAGYLAGVIFNFIANKTWSFQARKGAKQTTQQAVMYGILLGVNLLITNGLLLLMQSKGIGPEIGKVFVTGIITLWNFIIYNKVIFKPHADDQSSGTTAQADTAKDDEAS